MEPHANVPNLTGSLGKKGSMSDIDPYKEVMSNFGEVSFREVKPALVSSAPGGLFRYRGSRKVRGWSS
jgi:hypothetical protein